MWGGKDGHGLLIARVLTAIYWWEKSVFKAGDIPPVVVCAWKQPLLSP